MVQFRVVTESELRNPRLDLALVIRRLCETYWKEAGGNEERLNLYLNSHTMDLDRIQWLSKALQALLAGGLSPGFSPKSGGSLGVHLWPVNQLQQMILLIADSGEELNNEPASPFIARARQCAERAGFRLIWQHAPGAVWRIHIP